MNELLIKDGIRQIEQALIEFPWENSDCYANYLAQSYYFVCHSIPLLCSSAARFTEEQLSSRNRFITHMSEEHNHQLLALRDLRALARDISEFPELAATKMLYESMYYKVEHKSPYSLLGYILLLEIAASTIGPEVLKTLSNYYPQKALNFLKVHAQEDEDHVEKAYEVISSLPKNEQALVLECFEQSSFAYSRLIITLKDQYLSNQIKKVA